jgi:HAE1 family hydrophobic/amphiphilic exporter-1
MFISDLAIRKPVLTVVAMLALSVFGVISLSRLQTDEFPEVEPPVVSISIPYPGASPETVENEVIERVEEAIAGISGVDKIRSSALDSFAQIIVEFVFEKDVQQATQDIRDEISRIRADLPAEMEEPVLQRFDINELPIVSLTLSSNRLRAPNLTQIADPGITRQLRSIAGVAEVNVVGGVERQIVVEVRPKALAAAGLSVSDVVRTLQQQNLATPVGRVIERYQEDAIRLQGRLQHPEDFSGIVVKTSGTGAVRLGDVATVRDAFEEPRTAALYNGAEAVGIDIIKATNYSTTAVAEAVLRELEGIRRTLPEGVDLQVVRNSGERVAASVRDVEMALVEGAILTVLVVFVFLNSWRSTVITGLALPVSVLASFVAVWAFGFTLNTMSLLGLSLAIGILIDDAIVVRENIVRHMRMGKDHVRASIDGTDEIGLAVTATTLSIIVVFVPVAFMGGLAQQWFAPFALTIVASVAVSLFVSFSLDPMLSAHWPDPQKPEHEKGRITRKLDRFNHWFERQADRYTRVIRWALRHRLTVIALTIAAFVAAMALPVLGIVGASFFPVTDDSEFYVAIETPPGSSLTYTRAKTEEVSRRARAIQEVRYTYSTIGGRTDSVDEGSVYVRLKSKSERGRSESEISEMLRTGLRRLVGVTASISAGGMENQKEIQLQVQGHDLAVLNTIAEKIRAEVSKVPGAVDIGLSTRGRRPELVVSVERGLASDIGVSVADIAMAMRPAFAGIDVGDWTDPAGEVRDVYVRLAPEARTNVADIQSLPLVVSRPQGSRTIPLNQVAQVTRGLAPARIDHLNRERVIAVQANTWNRPLSEVINDINERIRGIALPPGYELTAGGSVEDQQEVFGRIFTALAVALLLMYFVLVVQFESFLAPVAILISLPLSLIGVMLALLVTGSTLNLMSLIGVILLMGIVAKNAILLIDFAKWSEESGTPREEAIAEAGRVRLRPILMTSFALVAGMTPVALGTGEGADFRAPLGRAVIGGVITSTALTLLVIPTVYDILVGWRDAFIGWFRRMLGTPREAPQEGQAD